MLWHGTTRARWELGIKQNGLRGDIPRHLVVDYSRFGYVFLTSSKQEACMYAIQTYFFDEQIESYKLINSVSMTGVVVGVKTSNLRKNLEADPEHRQQINYYKSKGILEEMEKIGWIGDWYMYYGNIAPSQIFGHAIVPIDHAENQWLIDIYREGTVKTFREKEVALK